MASAYDDPQIPFLPPEIHQAISRYVHDEDLPNYRLACKTFAEAGTPELFHTVLCRFSQANLARLDQIKQNAQLSKRVHTLIWDANRWRVGLDVRDWHEWTRYCGMRAKIAEEGNPEQSALYKELAESRQHWESYLSRLEDEKEGVERFMSGIFVDMVHEYGLPNLRKVHVVNGAYQLLNGRICKTETYAPLPVTIPLSSWKGDSFSRSNLRTLIYVLALSAPHIKKVRLDGIAGKELNMLSGAVLNHGADFALTSIRIRLAAQDTMHHSINTDALAVHMCQLRNLESIHIDLTSRIVGEDLVVSSVRTIQDTFEIQKKGEGVPFPIEGIIWPKLRKLSLRYFDSTARALLSLVARHSATLRDLRLHAISLCTEEPELTPSTPLSWPKVFQAIEATTKLEKVVLSGKFVHQRSFMNLDIETRAKAVAIWIVDHGECPIIDEKKWILKI